MEVKEAVETKEAFEETKKLFSLSDGPKKPLDAPSATIEYRPA
jgi:hypothetical protein